MIMRTTFMMTMCHHCAYSNAYVATNKRNITVVGLLFLCFLFRLRHCRSCFVTSTSVAFRSQSHKCRIGAPQRLIIIIKYYYLFMELLRPIEHICEINTHSHDKRNSVRHKNCIFYKCVMKMNAHTHAGTRRRTIKRCVSVTLVAAQWLE